MLTRYRIIGTAVLILLPIILVIWPPNFVKTEVFSHIAKDVSESTPYDLTIGQVSGNLLSGISLNHVRLVNKPDHVEVLRVRSIHLGIHGRALLHKTLQIDRMDWQEPILHLVWDEHKRLQLPFPSQLSRSSGGPRYSIENVTLEGGRITLANASLTPAKELTLHDISLKARINAREITIDRFQMALDGGTAHLTGRLLLTPSISSQWVLEDQNFPLTKLISTAASVPPQLRLVHSGKWNVQTDPHGVRFNSTGRFADAPLTLRGAWEQGRYQADVKWNQVPLRRFWRDSPAPGFLSLTLTVSGQGRSLNGNGELTAMLQPPSQELSQWADAQFHFSRGQGTFHAILGTTENKAVIEGSANLSERRVQGNYTMDLSRFDELSGLAPALSALRGRLKADGQFSRTAAGWSAQNRITGEKLFWHETPLDLQSLQIAVTGLPPRWKSTTSLKLRSGFSMEFSGSLAENNRFWSLAWNRLGLTFASGESWSSVRPGYATVGPNDSLDIHDFDLACGDQSIQAPRALLGKDSGRVELSVKRIDLNPWAKLYGSDVSLDGRLNASIQLEGRWTDPRVNGYVDGHINTLAFKPASLVVKNIDIDLRSANNLLEVRRFAGKTKKSEFDITGKSRLPALAFTLKANKWVFEGNPEIKGIVDVEMHLDGALQSPAITGRVGLEEATYKVAAKKKSASPSAALGSPDETPKLSLWRKGTIDISINWPRNVWYRRDISSIETQGDLHLKKNENNPNVVLMGSIREVRGTYTYYGRTFHIESGEIQFPGTVELNPVLNVEASYTSGPTEVYLDITGPLDKPSLKMRSNPPLSDQDIVSVIVFGQPLSELRSQTGGVSSNQEMMQAVGGVLGSYLSKGLNQTGIPALNFDVLNIQPADEGGSQLTLGRYLTKKLFITYGQTVQGAAEKTLTADYFLTEKWTLEGASDSVEGNYLDFLFRYPLNKRGSPADNSPLPKSPFRNTLDVPVTPTEFRTPMQ